MNWRILEQVNCEEKKTKLSVSSMLIQIESMIRFSLNHTVFQLLARFQFETIESKPRLLGRKLPSNLECILGSREPRERGGGGYTPPHWPANQNAE